MRKNNMHLGILFQSFSIPIPYKIGHFYSPPLILYFTYVYLIYVINIIVLSILSVNEKNNQNYLTFFIYNFMLNPLVFFDFILICIDISLFSFYNYL